MSFWNWGCMPVASFAAAGTVGGGRTAACLSLLLIRVLDAFARCQQITKQRVSSQSRCRSDFSTRVDWEEQTSPSCQSRARVLAGPGLACSFMCTLAPSPTPLLCVTTHGLLLSFVYVPEVVPVTQVTAEMLYRML